MKEKGDKLQEYEDYPEVSVSESNENLFGKNYLWNKECEDLSEE